MLWVLCIEKGVLQGQSLYYLGTCTLKEHYCQRHRIFPKPPIVTLAIMFTHVYWFARIVTLKDTWTKATIKKRTQAKRESKIPRGACREGKLRLRATAQAR